jgi:hypothetical protein
LIPSLGRLTALGAEARRTPCGDRQTAHGVLVFSRMNPMHREGLHLLNDDGAGDVRCALRMLLLQQRVGWSD